MSGTTNPPPAASSQPPAKPIAPAQPLRPTHPGGIQPVASPQTLAQSVASMFLGFLAKAGVPAALKRLHVGGEVNSGSAKGVQTEVNWVIKTGDVTMDFEPGVSATMAQTNANLQQALAEADARINEAMSKAEGDDKHHH